MFAIRTAERVISKRKDQVVPPSGKAANSFSFGFIHFMEHAKDNTSDSTKKTVEKGTVFQKEMPQFFINGENTVSVCTLNQFERHSIRALLTVFHTAGRAEAAFAAERNEFQHPAFGTGVHGAAKGRVTTVNHLVDIADDSLSGM